MPSDSPVGTKRFTERNGARVEFSLSRHVLHSPPSLFEFRLASGLTITFGLSISSIWFQRSGTHAYSDFLVGPVYVGFEDGWLEVYDANTNKVR